jgi:hypothetical protein
VYLSIPFIQVQTVRHSPTSSSPNRFEVAENDELRSQFMRWLIAAQPMAQRAAPTRSTPRVLVQFWDDLASIPDDVQTCIDSWDPLESAGFERRLFDDAAAYRFLAAHFTPRHLDAFARCRHPAMRADYFRLCFILNVGGMYVDADDEYHGADLEHLLCDGLLRLQALCYDIPSDSMLDVSRASEGESSADQIFYVNNNPLIAPPAHPLIAAALERSTVHLLAATEQDRDIQSLTGPGNLTASLVAHAVRAATAGETRDFELLTDWGSIAVSKWPLEYRTDERNWRNWVKGSERAERP